MTPRAAFSVSGKRVVVVGAARSGVAAAELLVRRGAAVILTDIRAHIEDEERLRAAGVDLELGGHNAETLTRADLIVLSPGVPPRQPALDAARRAGVPVMGELELASRWLRGRIVAITGTKGKSTTTTLTGRMLEAGGHRVLVGGNIGHALSAQVEDSTEDTIHVVEASSFQLETVETFHPWIAVLLNFSPDHLDRHADVDEYAAAKASMDDALAEGVVLSGDTIARKAATRREALVPLAAVKLLGRHLLADVLAAAAVATIAGVAPDAMTRAVESFTGLEHALEPAGEIGAVRFVNDSKATNIESAHRAIESFGPGLVVILGERFKGGDFADLRAALVERAAVVVAIGEAAPLVHKALEGIVPVRDAADLRAAVRTAFASARPGETVLLAPACASFDMFRDYAERGRAFKQEVARLQQDWNGTREQ
ncbi:MAG: UDP-N-acetylmuramoyl-L-alanine--D-glutamate ligase [Acidobacteria bacterium]|nr:MAG: UDP-N-acetylmuramoyl-L-alanine--D-glutamate ligase [Acidobacteriota bacterium]